MKYYMIITALLICSFAVHAQAPADNTETKAAMKTLENWVGQWKGEGTTTTRQGIKKSKVTENITFKLDNTLLFIEGQGIATDETTKTEKVVHNALGVLTYNAATKQYTFNSWLSDGRSTNAWFIVKSTNEFEWGFDVPQGKIKYSITLTSTTWNEVGEFSMDGKTWMKTFEMNLTRQ